jgi:hypothetical protein
MYATFNAMNSFPGAGPTGTVTFYDGATQIPGPVTYSNGQPGGTDFPASLTAYVTATFATIGTHTITAKYSGDVNYAAATGLAVSQSAVYATTAAATANPTTVNYGQNVNLTVTITSGSKTPPMTGTFQFSGQILSPTSPVTPTPGTDANGNQTLTAIVPVTPQNSTVIYVNYTGDANYESNSATAFVTVIIPDFSLNLPASPLLVTAGQSGTLVATIVPASNAASSVSLSCGGNAGGELPAGYSCTFSPAIVNLSNGASAMSNFTLAPTTQAPAKANHRALTPGSLRINHHPVSLNGILVFLGLLAITLLVWPVRWPNRRMRSAIFVFGVICFAIGCGASSSGSGGGGIIEPQPTTITVNTSAAKVPYSTPLSFTATVSGSNNPTGDVLFYLNGSFVNSAALIGNTATISGVTPFLGVYSLTAQYTGDLKNDPSTSAGVNVGVTGTSSIGVQGVTSTIDHMSEVTYTIQ